MIQNRAMARMVLEIFRRGRRWRGGGGLFSENRQPHASPDKSHNATTNRLGNARVIAILTCED
jgi:hypothetical protein